MEEEQNYQPTPGPRSGAPWPRRVRVSIEGAWKEAVKLAETLLDTLALPAGGFSIVAFGWLTSVFFFALSIAVGAVVAAGGLLLFIGLECLALMAYAYPGALFLVAVAGSLAPPLVLYWLLHSLLDIQGNFSDWGAYPLLLMGLFGSYYYWRFGRVIATTGAGAMAFYRGAAPKASEIFGAPFAIFSGVWDIVKLVLGLFRRVASEFFALLGRRARGTAATGSTPRAASGGRDAGSATTEDADPDEPSVPGP